MKQFTEFFKSLTEYFESNEYMTKYIELLNNYKSSTEGEKHHAIPVCFYKQKYKCKSRKAAERLANEDINNIIIQLPIPQHVLAHFYLCRCCVDKLMFERLFNAFKLLHNTRDLTDLEAVDEATMLTQAELAKQERQKDCFGKPVLCIETNIVYPNICAANESMGKDRYKYHGIYNTCVGRKGQKSALGYHWCFYDEGVVPEDLLCYLDSQKPTLPHNTSKSIYCVETHEVFKSAYEAGVHFGVNRKRILDSCRKPYLTINGLHVCFLADRNAFITPEFKTNYNIFDEKKKNISIGTTLAMAKIPEYKKQEMREKNKKYWAENKLHYYNNGIEEARLPECPEGWVAGRLEKYRTKGKPVKCVELNTVYASAVVAAKELGINSCGINNCVNGHTKSAGGYTWQRV